MVVVVVVGVVVLTFACFDEVFSLSWLYFTVQLL